MKNLIISFKKLFRNINRLNKISNSSVTLIIDSATPLPEEFYAELHAILTKYCKQNED